MKQIKLADIAKETGYSVNTVSHALLDKPDIAEKTKKYIREAAERMGYIANISASALRSGKSKTIAIIVGDISNPHFSIMIKEMEGKLRGYGYNTFILNTDENENIEREAIISAIGKNVDGIIICPVQKSRKNISFIIKNDIPYVLLGRRFEGASLNYVICDDLNGGYAAAEHLIKLNHKKLLFINGLKHISSARDRKDGVLRAADNLGIGNESVKIAEIKPSPEDAQLLNILEKNSDCTGIICFSDMIALKACYYLKELGRAVPEDVSVIGFDNIASKFYMPLMLTSVTSSKTKMSVKAVDTLMAIIENKSNLPHQYILPTKVIGRDTTRKI